MAINVAILKLICEFLMVFIFLVRKKQYSSIKVVSIVKFYYIQCSSNVCDIFYIYLLVIWQKVKCLI
ncbi:hypothetical protein B6S12_07245 [Helicobacter valdiviensis]|uniref:Uncharacterized protein n=1 Tax=Helicobacter valdiviensis TaxID=1458358 RepID=A0A2W6MTD3_9HELI|nr:hypothetical protein B6S12_07245 [Helicobacter valdiviensis]